MRINDNFLPQTGIMQGTESPLLRWRVLDEGEWRTLRDVRLTALSESPQSFLSRYDTEVTFEEERWRAEFSRGEWIIVNEKSKAPVALVGITRSDDVPLTGRYIEFLWVSPEMRRSGLATILIQAVLERLEASGADTAWLWILDGNEPARELYNKCGFITTGVRHQPSADRSLWEERMNRRLNPKV